MGFSKNISVAGETNERKKKKQKRKTKTHNHARSVTTSAKEIKK
jgi:hypothetical protein